MARFEIIIGHDVDNRNPYTINKAQPNELIIRNFLISLIKNEMSKTAIATYPTHSVFEKFNNSIFKLTYYVFYPPL